MTYVGNGPESHRIIPPAIRTQNIESMERQAADLEAEAAERATRLREFRVAIAQMADAMQSPGSESLHMEMRYAAVEAQNVIDAMIGTAKFVKSMASVQRGVDRRQSEIDREGHEKLSNVKTFVEREAIVAEHFGWAESYSISAMGEIATMTARWESTHHREFQRIQVKYQAPRPDPVAPPHNLSPGIVKPLDVKTSRGKHARGDAEESGTEQSSGAGRAGDRDASTKPKTGTDSKPGQTASEWPQGEPGSPAGGLLPGSQAPSRSVSPSPLSSSSGVSGAGMPSGGSSSGGGLGSGLGSNPLSSLGGGLGQSPAGALGSSGLSSTNPTASAASNPGSAFARGFSSASSVVPPPVASPPPAAGTGSTAPVAGPSSVPPVTGAASGGPVAAGAHGMVTPATAAGTPGGSLPLLPSPGMGAPAAAGATAAVTPVGSSSTATAGTSSPGAAAAPTGNVGATLVPAALVNAAAPDRAVQGLSPDAKAAAMLAWKLRHDSIQVTLGTHWAVGVFRSGASAETVVLSAEGSGYVPANVHVPRGVWLLVADPLVDTEFRKRWFGWPDPARVLVEYAKLRKDTGWELVAAATTGTAAYLRDCGAEYVECTDSQSPIPEKDPPAALDEMHVHRLQLEYPDLYDRLARLAIEGNPELVESVAEPLTQDLVSSALGVAVDKFEDTTTRDLLRDRWEQVKTGADIPDSEWRNYASVMSTEFLMPFIEASTYSSAEPSSEHTRVYQNQWHLGRALEAVAGWAGWPKYRISLPDIVYAAAAVEPDADIREKIAASLRAAEAAMGW